MSQTTWNPGAFHVLAKPCGAICNLDCTYCDFLSKEQHYLGSDFRISENLLEVYICQYIETSAGETGLNYLCDGCKAFFVHVHEPMTYRAQQLRRRQPPANVMLYMSRRDGEG